jgi:hypothetical protein
MYLIIELGVKIPVVMSNPPILSNDLLLLKSKLNKRNIKIPNDIYLIEFLKWKETNPDINIICTLLKEKLIQLGKFYNTGPISTVY